MRTQKIYLETTLFNYYFDEDRDAHDDTVTLFAECASGKFEPYASDYVIKEIEDAPEEKREKMLGLLKRYDIVILAADNETDDLAGRYVTEGAFPQGSIADASHIAAASVNGLDMIISLNFRHIVKERTIEMTSAVNTLSGYKPMKIKTPMEVIDDEKTRYHIGRNTRDTS